jgi:hypothetical protein
MRFELMEIDLNSDPWSSDEMYKTDAQLENLCLAIHPQSPYAK